ncbi:MAG: MinD/ParA family protein [Planctomycetota bacterium]|nr:MinD/ParA family protein [Planctomycetota bacterium]
MNTATRRASTVAVTSGKGGVGKSNVAVNLAIRLTQLGRRVVLLDADLGTANADVLCDLQPTGTVAHVVAGRRTLAETMMEAPGGFRLIPGASGLAQVAAMSEFERARLMQMVQEIEAETDLILIDTGAGVGPNVLSFAAGADEMLVVTTPEPTSITDAYAMIKTVHRQRGGANVRVLVNMTRDAAEGRGVFERINAVSRKFLDLELRYAGHVVTDAKVGQAVRRRRPFVLDSPTCEAAVCIGQLAHRLDRNAAEPRGAGLLERISGWIAG